MGVVESSRGNLQPPSQHLLSEPAIVTRLARAVLEKGSLEKGSELISAKHPPGRSGKSVLTPFLWESLADDYDRIRDLIAQVIPGCEDYNRRVRQPAGFYLPNAPREGRFPTKSGKAEFSVNSLPELRLEPGQLFMTTIRTHDQFNTTVYGLNDRYRGVHNERRVVFLNADDMRERGLSSGDAVDLTSHFNGSTRTARQFRVVPYDIPRGCAASYFPEANVLVPIESVAKMSNTPTSKCIVITVNRREAKH